jgi:predicted  nucleic acid-binding Zn-ribbon protein
MIVDSGKVNSWVVGRHNYRVQRRKEYGAGAASTTTRNINAAKIWTDQPVDQVAHRELEEKISTLFQEFEEIKKQVLPLRERIQELRNQRSDVMADVVSHQKSFGQ